MKFPYRFFEGRFLPIIPIRLKGTQEWVEVKAFVDTGASYSLFPADAAELLGFILEAGEPNEMVVGDGNTLQVFIHKIFISIAGKEFIASIRFSKGLGVGFYIIGTRDIFDHFIVSFNQKEKYLEFIAHN